ncbi:MAG: 50S ribosomal protein L3 N(5)-glutamine methyltransferase, partial [Pseudomonas sp.]
MITSRLRTLRDYIRWAVSRFHEHELFFGHGADNAWDEARLLVLGAVHLPWEIADSYLDCQLEDDERVRLQHL